MQYTLRKIPRHLDQALRRKARQERKSLNRVALEALMRGAGLSEKPIRHRNVRDLVGCWYEDPETEEVLAAQRVIEPELWR